MWKERQQAQPCVGRGGRSDAACTVSSPPFKTERESETFPLLFSPLYSSPLLSVERFSSHLLSKTSTIGVTSPTRSSWSCWAAVCACKCFWVFSQTVCFLEIFSWSLHSPGLSSVFINGACLCVSPWCQCMCAFITDAPSLTVGQYKPF